MFCTKYFDVFTCGDRQMCTLKYTCTYIHTNMPMYISACLSDCTVTHSLWATHSCCLIHFSFSALALGNLLEQHIHTHTTHTYIYVCMFVAVFFFCFGNLLYCHCRPSSPFVVVFHQFFAHVRLKRLFCDFRTLR